MICPKCGKPIEIDHTYRIVDDKTVEHVNCDVPITLREAKEVPPLKWNFQRPS